MKTYRYFLAALLFLFCAPAYVQAQTAKVIATCGSGITYQVGDIQPVLQDTTGSQCSTATLSGSITASTEYTEDAAAAANPVGGVVICVRRDTLTAAEVSANGDNVACKANNEGRIMTSAVIDTALPAGAATIGNVGLVAGTNTVGGVNLAAKASGGCTLGKTLSAASTNSTSVTATQSTLCSLNVVNTTATLYYLKLYNKATAATCNSDTVLQTIPIPASATGAGIAVAIGPFGWDFSLGITFCLTGGIADNDNANAATGVAINYSTK